MPVVPRSRPPLSSLAGLGGCTDVRSSIRKPAWLYFGGLLPYVVVCEVKPGFTGTQCHFCLILSINYESFLPSKVNLSYYLPDFVLDKPVFTHFFKKLANSYALIIIPATACPYSQMEHREHQQVFTALYR